MKTSDTVDQTGMEKAKIDMYQAAIEVLKAPGPTSNEGIVVTRAIRKQGRIPSD